MKYFSIDLPCNVLTLVSKRPQIPNYFVDLRYFEAVKLQQSLVEGIVILFQVFDSQLGRLQFDRSHTVLFVDILILW